MMSQLCPGNVRQSASLSVFQGEHRPQKTAKNVSTHVFGRQGPEVRILSPRPLSCLIFGLMLTLIA